MPAAVAAGIAKTALVAPAVGGGLGALGAGLTLGTKIAGGGIFSNFMAGAAPALTSGLGASAAPIMASVAPAATAQAMGPSMLQSAGLEALKGKVIGGGVQQAAAQQASNLAIQQAAAQNMAGGLANPMSQMGAKFLANSQAAGMPLAKPFGAETMLATNATNVAPNAFQQAHTVSGPGLNAKALQMPSLSNPTVSPLSTTQAANPADIVGRSIRPDQNFMQNLGNIGSFQDVKDYAEQHPYATSAAVGLGTMGLSKMMQQKRPPTPENNAMIRPYDFDYGATGAAYQPGGSTSEQLYFNPTYTAGEPYKADEKAEGGIASAYAMGGQVEQMSAMNSVGANTGYPMANINTPMYANPMMQRPEAMNVIAPSADAGVGAYSGEQRFAEGGEAKTEGGYTYSFDPTTQQFTQLSVPTIKAPTTTVMGGMGAMGPIGAVLPPQPVKNSGSKLSGGIATPAMGPMQSQQASTPTNIPAYQSPEQQLGLEGFYEMMNQRLAGYGGYGGFAAGGGVGGEPNLGGYSDGGRLLKGPGDGVSDSIPASIGNRQPARLADGEFVVPARIVSELGNGSTEAGARKLYAMMDRVQKSRKKSVGKGKVAVDSKASKHLPA